MIDQFGRYFPGNQFQQPYQALQRTEIIHVNGRPGAEAYQLAANSNVLLLDDTQPIIWLKQTDGAGYANLTPYSITPYQPEPQISSKDLLARIEKIEEKLNESNTQSTRWKTGNESV